MLALAAMLALGPRAWAEAPRSAEGTVRKSKEGLNFQVPPDWPIEKRNGIMGPIPIEEYLSMKFSAIEARLRNVEQELSAFDVRLRVLEEDAKKAKTLESSGGGGAP
jgi:hypothetical protein